MDKKYDFKITKPFDTVEYQKNENGLYFIKLLGIECTYENGDVSDARVELYNMHLIKNPETPKGIMTINDFAKYLPYGVVSIPQYTIPCEDEEVLFEFFISDEEE